MEFDTSPALGPAYLRALVDRRPARMPVGAHAPRLEARLAPHTPDARGLDAYREVCGFGASNEVPITYPHILAAGIQMAMLSDRRFPVRLAGLVHVSNRIRQHRAMRPNEAPAIACWLEGSETTPSGEVFTLHTAVTVDDETFWEEETTFIARSSGGGNRRRRPREEEPTWQAEAEWSVPADTGRRYASVSGDYNPIHLWRLTGKLFGFPGAIAHGMWSLARCAAQLTAGGNCTLEARFVRPLVLPATAIFARSNDAQSGAYRLASPDGKTVYLSGTLDTF